MILSTTCLRSLVEQTVNAILSEDAGAVCGAGYGTRSAERTNQRNGYRERRWDTRAGAIDRQLPKLRNAAISRTGCRIFGAALRRRW